MTTIADEYGNSINFRVGDRVAVRGSDGSDMTTGIGVDANVDGTAIKWSASDIITVADDKAYIDIDAIVEAISKV